MNDNKVVNFLAIDLGASSGRAIVGSISNNNLKLKEIKRFQNPIIEVNDYYYWDLLHLYNQIIESLKEVRQKGYNIESAGIDTWGVDYVCFGDDGQPLRMPSSYRDPSTFGAPEKFFQIVSKEEVYKRTGIQIMNFNSLFQLYTQMTNGSSIYKNIDKILFMPDALSYMLTGKMVTEYTIASTSQMMNPFTKEIDKTLLEAVNLNSNHFAPIVFSGSEIGKISPTVEKLTDLKDISVIAVAGHDTASAVLAVPAKNKNFAYLSSGTWSLMGIEIEEPIINEETFALNFTNEGGADGSIRLLKNICGMWLIEQCKKEWESEKEVTYDEIVNAALNAEPFKCFINPDAPSFASPDSMINSIREHCKNTGQYVPTTMGEIARCIYESLAFRYRQVLSNLQKLATFPIEALHIIGGGSKNNMLNQFTANAIGITVEAGPSEATAIGNILLQAKAAGLVQNTQEMRDIVRNSTELETFIPSETDTWNKNYQNYLDVFKEI